MAMTKAAALAATNATNGLQRLQYFQHFADADGLVIAADELERAVAVAC